MLPGDFQPKRLEPKKVALLGVLGFVSLASFVGVVFILLFVISAWLGRPLSVFGYTEGPDQPVAFPHTVHAGTVEDGGIGLDCTFCHRNVTEGPAATVPAVGLCMTCHAVVGEGLVEVEKLREYAVEGEPIDWVRVHRVPDHVRFNHQAHVSFFSEQDVISASAVCATCHGSVEKMVKVRQVLPLKMGNCVDCHRDNSAPTDCTTCHY